MVQSVEMRDVVVPESLQDAISREAQAAREKEARLILGQNKVELAHLFARAASEYEHNPTALHLRAMNILYEGLKDKGALRLAPSTAVESMGLGGLLGAAAIRRQVPSQDQATSSPVDGLGQDQAASALVDRPVVPVVQASGTHSPILQNTPTPAPRFRCRCLVNRFSRKSWRGGNR